jgi:hypothetical protein
MFEVPLMYYHEPLTPQQKLLLQSLVLYHHKKLPSSFEQQLSHYYQDNVHTRSLCFHCLKIDQDLHPDVILDVKAVTREGKPLIKISTSNNKPLCKPIFLNPRLFLLEFTAVSSFSHFNSHFFSSLKKEISLKKQTSERHNKHHADFILDLVKKEINNHFLSIFKQSLFYSIPSEKREQDFKKFDKELVVKEQVISENPLRVQFSFQDLKSGITAGFSLDLNDDTNLDYKVGYTPLLWREANGLPLSDTEFSSVSDSLMRFKTMPPATMANYDDSTVSKPSMTSIAASFLRINKLNNPNDALYPMPSIRPAIGPSLSFDDRKQPNYPLPSTLSTSLKPWKTAHQLPPSHFDSDTVTAVTSAASTYLKKNATIKFSFKTKEGSEHVIKIPHESLEDSSGISNYLAGALGKYCLDRESPINILLPTEKAMAGYKNQYQAAAKTIQASLRSYAKKVTIVQLLPVQPSDVRLGTRNR